MVNENLLPVQRFIDNGTRYVNNLLGESRPYFAAFGAWSAVAIGTVTAYQLLKGLTTYCLAGPLALGKNVREYGEWAVVTGASDGIGFSYCKELARRGMNIVLVAHNEEKVNQAAHDIEITFRCKTKVIVAEFKENDMGVYTNIQAQLTGMRIGVLVNNVGQGCSSEKFLENPPDSQSCIDMVNTNTTSYVMMSRMILPGMVTRGKGIIVNISSVNGDIPTPGAALYSGTKAFIDFFSCALNDEYKDKGIIVQSVMPGAVDTKMVQEEHRNSFFCVKPDDFVRDAVSQIGVRTRTYGSWRHAVMQKARKTIPGQQWLT